MEGQKEEKKKKKVTLEFISQSQIKGDYNFNNLYFSSTHLTR